MFDTYRLDARMPDVHVHHIEKRAPTDESVRLLKEMEQKARDKVVESMRLESNTVTCVVHRFEDCMDMSTKFAIHYELNGHKREVKITFHDIYQQKTIQDMRREIWQAVSEDVAAFLLQASGLKV